THQSSKTTKKPSFCVSKEEDIDFSDDIQIEDVKREGWINMQGLSSRPQQTEEVYTREKESFPRSRFAQEENLITPTTTERQLLPSTDRKREEGLLITARKSSERTTEFDNNKEIYQRLDNEVA